MAIVQEIGANAPRLVHYPFDLYVLQFADKLSYLVINEVPAVRLNFKD